MSFIYRHPEIQPGKGHEHGGCDVARRVWEYNLDRGVPLSVRARPRGEGHDDPMFVGANVKC